MGFFGKKKKEAAGERTVLIVHVENGSVGAALARLSPEAAPKLFGETRTRTNVPMSVSGSALSAAIEDAAREALRHSGEVAARVRLHPKTTAMGSVDSAAVFLAAPWGRPNLSTGRPDFLDSMSGAMRDKVEQSFGLIPTTFYTAAGSAAFGARSFISDEPCLVCVVTGEVSELMRLDHGGVQAHATFPTGSHGLLRTLQTHGGLSIEEARSAARLPFDAAHVREPFAAAAGEFARHFQEAARDLMRPGDILRVTVVAEEPMGEWFARALGSGEHLLDLFPEGGEVRALRAQHAMPHIAAHAAAPDLSLMLAALFVDSHINP